MVTHNGLMRIFWPSDAPKDASPGVLVGFQNSKSDVFVVAVLQDVELRQVENALLVGSLLRHSPHDIQELLQRCGHSALRALGSVNPKTLPHHPSVEPLVVYTDPMTRFPRLHYPTDTHMTTQVIVYDRPHPTRMQYLSLKPITLALGDKTRVAEWDGAFAELEQAEIKERKRKAQLVERLKLHKVIAHPPTRKEMALPMLIEQVNCSHELNALLQKNIGMIGRRMKRALSVSERVAESANDLWHYTWMVLHYIFRVWIWPIAAHLFIFGLITHRILGEAVILVLHWQPGAADSPALKDISATAQQIDIRLQQSCYWPIQYLTLRRRKANWESITNSHPEYIRFYNSLWLVANDVIMGIAVGTFIIENASFVAAQVDTIFSAWSVEGLRRMISWLMGWPGGLKLNTELAAFLGDLFLWVIDYWASKWIPLTWIPFDMSTLLLTNPRLHIASATTSASPHPGHWLLGFCWRHHAHLHFLRPRLLADHPHILILRCFCPYLSLAAHDHHFPIPSLSRKKAQHPPQPNRLLRLRFGPAAARHHPLHPTILPPSNGIRLLLDLCKRTYRRHWTQSSTRDGSCMSKSLSAVCRYAAA